MGIDLSKITKENEDSVRQNFRDNLDVIEDLFVKDLKFVADVESVGKPGENLPQYIEKLIESFKELNITKQRISHLTEANRSAKEINKHLLGEDAYKRTQEVLELVNSIVNKEDYEDENIF